MNRFDARFGRYQVTGVLGQGGFATVYRAWDPILGREVALKALLPHLSASGEVRRRFLAELQALARLRYAHIVTVHDAGEELGQPYFAMELIDGPTLADLTRGGRQMPLDEAGAICRDLGSAVDYLHAAGLVHRDIKPANIMRERSGRTVLMDFGIARLLDGTHHTRAGSGLGTPEFMAPEQVLDQPAGPPADIYALAALAYHLLAGRPPFTGNAAHVLHAHVYDPPSSLRSLRPGLPEALYRAIESGLAKQPLARPAGGATLAAAFEPSRSVARPRSLNDLTATTIDRHQAVGSAPRPPRGSIGRAAVATPERPPQPVVGRVVTTVAGKPTPGFADGPAAEARFRSPQGIAVDGAGTIYVADTYNHRIRAIAADGSVRTLAGSGERGFVDGASSSACFDTPMAVAVAANGAVYVVERGNHAVRRVDPDGAVSTVAGSGSRGYADGEGRAAQFFAPRAIAVGSDGTIYVADLGNNRIRTLTPEGSASTLTAPEIAGFPEGPLGATRALVPAGIAAGEGGVLYVADDFNNCLHCVEPDGDITTLAVGGDERQEVEQFQQPSGVAIGPDGSIYLAESGAERIRAIMPDGAVRTVAGVPEAGYEDGPAALALFRRPIGLALAADRSLYAVDSLNHCIRRIALAEAP